MFIFSLIYFLVFLIPLLCKMFLLFVRSILFSPSVHAISYLSRSPILYFIYQTSSNFFHLLSVSFSLQIFSLSNLVPSNFKVHFFISQTPLFFSSSLSFSLPLSFFIPLSLCNFSLTIILCLLIR